MSPVAGSLPDEAPGSAELLARELVEADRVREAEYEAVLRDLSVKDVYVRDSEVNLALSEDRERPGALDSATSSAGCANAPPSSSPISNTPRP